MVIVIADYQAQPGNGARVAAILARHVEATRAEAGCVDFIAYRDSEDPDHFALYERYVDEAAFEAHRDTPHFKTYIDSGVVPLLSHRRWHRLEEVPPAPPGDRAPPTGFRR